MKITVSDEFVDECVVEGLKSARGNLKLDLNSGYRIFYNNAKKDKKEIKKHIKAIDLLLTYFEVQE